MWRAASGCRRSWADRQSAVFIELGDRGGEDPWRRVRDALDAAGDDWWEYLHLPSHAAGTAAS